jgi:hypothetical protein
MGKSLMTARRSYYMHQTKFNFDNGTTQGWRASNLMDDSNKQYCWPGGFPVFVAEHWERSNYPVPQLGTNQIDPTKNIGCLMIRPTANSQLLIDDAGLGFPADKKWRVEIASGQTAADFSGIQGYKAGVCDQMSWGGKADTSQITATIFLRGEQNGKTIDIGEKANGEFVCSPLTASGKAVNYDTISNKFTVPAGVKVRFIVIRIEGEYAKGYEGWILVDNVCPI